MCWMVALPMAIGAAATLVGSRNASQDAKAQNQALSDQAKETIRQSNFQQADLDLNARDRLEEATSEATANNMQRVQAMGTLRAAIGEGNLEGNSMDRILRVSEGDYIRQNAMLTDQYRRDYASIFAAKVGNAESTEGNVKSLNSQHSKGPSKLKTAVDVGLSAGSAWAGSSLSGGLQAGNSGVSRRAKGTRNGR